MEMIYLFQKTKKCSKLEKNETFNVKTDNIIKEKTINNCKIDKTQIDYNPFKITKRENIYEKMLDSNEWKEKRKLILIRDNYKCRYCGSEYNLQVHHKYYNKYPNGVKVLSWDYPNDALITLCDSCHEKVHKTKVIKTYFRRYTEHF